MLPFLQGQMHGRLRGLRTLEVTHLVFIVDPSKPLLGCLSAASARVRPSLRTPGHSLGAGTIMPVWVMGLPMRPPEPWLAQTDLQHFSQFVYIVWSNPRKFSYLYFLLPCGNGLNAGEGQNNINW